MQILDLSKATDPFSGSVQNISTHLNNGTEHQQQNNRHGNHTAGEVSLSYICIFTLRKPNRREIIVIHSYVVYVTNALMYLNLTIYKVRNQPKVQ